MKKLKEMYFTKFYEDLKDDAKEYFGIVPDYYSNVGFYINTDGTILDGSGETLGNTNGRLYGQRTVDHREVASIFNDSISGGDAMIAYMNEGNIRWMPEAPGFELIKEPTSEQYNTMMRLIAKMRDVFLVEIANNWGEDIWSREYEKQVRWEAIDDIKKYFKDTKQEKLTEDTRTQLVNASKNIGLYKDKSKGKNRFERKRLSKIANQVKSYNKLDMNKFFKEDVLEIEIPVIGETNTYIVTLRLNKVVDELRRNIVNNNNRLEYKNVVQAVTKIFNTTDVYVNCSCKDFEMRFKHWSIVNNYGTEDTAHDPGPGKGITNPNDDQGKGCKHVLLVLANLAWVNNVSSVIKNYVFYISEKQPELFKKIIFPKLYGVDIENAKEEGIIPEDLKLDSKVDLINEINEWSKNRGKIQKGSNKNPAAGKSKLELKKDETEEEEK